MTIHHPNRSEGNPARGPTQEKAEHALANDSLCRHYHVASVDTRRQTQGLQQRSPG